MLIFLKFITVGIANTLSTLAVIFGLKALFGTDDITANAIGYAVGIMLGFVANNRWTFGLEKMDLKRLAKYIVVSLVAYLANLSVVLLLSRQWGVNGYIAQISGMPAYTAVAFVLSKYFVFKA